MNESERLWAPWRLEFITEDDVAKRKRKEENQIEVGPGADPHCFICQANADSQDQKRFVFFRSDHSIGILNRYPYNNGHLLIAPKKHLSQLSELTETELLDLNRQIIRFIDVLKKEMQPDGFNIGINLGHAAGAGLPGHLHWHIVPRWIGDTNFMTSIASTKVIPQSLETLWTILTRNP